MQFHVLISHVLAADVTTVAGYSLALVLLASFLILFAKDQRKKALTSNTPAVPSVPVFGSLFELIRNFPRMPDFFLENTLKYQRTFQIKVPIFEQIGQIFVLTTEENVRYLLKDNFHNFEKGKNFRYQFEQFFGAGIFASDGAEWEFHRKVASTMFTRNLLRSGTVVAHQQGSKLIDKISSLLERSETDSIEVDIQDMFFRFTIDVFCEIAFGIQLDSLIAKEQHPFAKTFDKVQAMTLKRSTRLGWKLRKKFWPLFKFETELRAEIAQLDKFALSVISTKRRLAKEGSLGPDLISRFLERKQKADERKGKAEQNQRSRETKDTDATGGGLGDKELRDIVLNFIIAGRDTTACALSWLMYELATNPQVHEKIIAEAMEAGVWTAGGLTYDSISSLKYLQAAVAETLRLHPSVPKDVKFAINDCRLPDGTFIPKHSAVLYIPYAMGRNPRIWENPLSFNPDRFLNEGNFVEPSMYKYIAFNAGPRLCLGKPLAYLEIKLMALMLIQRFNFALSRKEHLEAEPPYVNTLVLPIKNGLPMKFSFRTTL